MQGKIIKRCYYYITLFSIYYMKCTEHKRDLVDT